MWEQKGYGADREWTLQRYYIRREERRLWSPGNPDVTNR
jgi:hypothetical protein